MKGANGGVVGSLVELKAVWVAVVWVMVSFSFEVDFPVLGVRFS
jgi:hypothetical protein